MDRKCLLLTLKQWFWRNARETSVKLQLDESWRVSSACRGIGNESVQGDTEGKSKAGKFLHRYHCHCHYDKLYTGRLSLLSHTHCHWHSALDIAPARAATISPDATRPGPGVARRGVANGGHFRPSELCVCFAIKRERERELCETFEPKTGPNQNRAQSNVFELKREREKLLCNNCNGREISKH